MKLKTIKQWGEDSLLNIPMILNLVFCKLQHKLQKSLLVHHQNLKCIKIFFQQQDLQIFVTGFISNTDKIQTYPLGNRVTCFGGLF